MKINGVEIAEAVKKSSKNQDQINKKEKLKNTKTPKKTTVPKKITPEEIDILTYDKTGKVIIDSEKKQSIIDFFH